MSFWNRDKDTVVEQYIPKGKKSIAINRHMNELSEEEVQGVTDDIVKTVIDWFIKQVNEKVWNSTSITGTEWIDLLISLASANVRDKVADAIRVDFINSIAWLLYFPARDLGLYTADLNKKR